MRHCAFCDELLQNQRIGDESYRYCSNCNLTEGDYYDDEMEDSDDLGCAPVNPDDYDDAA